MLQDRLKTHVPVINHVTVLSSVLNSHNLELLLGTASNYPCGTDTRNKLLT
jgi:hypothetical protein